MMMWLVLLVAALMVHTGDAQSGRCPKDWPIKVTLKFKTKNKAMQMTMVPPTGKPFHALAGSGKDFSFDEGFKFILQVKEGWEEKVSTDFKLKKLCFRVRGANKVIAKFPGAGIDDKEVNINKPTSWKKVCFKNNAVLKRIDVVYKQAGPDPIEVKSFFSKSCHQEVEEDE